VEPWQVLFSPRLFPLQTYGISRYSGRQEAA
jgi:hypothetical protein